MRQVDQIKFLDMLCQSISESTGPCFRAAERFSPVVNVEFLISSGGGVTGGGQQPRYRQQWRRYEPCIICVCACLRARGSGLLRTVTFELFFRGAAAFLYGLFKPAAGDSLRCIAILDAVVQCNLKSSISGSDAPAARRRTMSVWPCSPAACTVSPHACVEPTLAPQASSIMIVNGGAPCRAA